MRMTIDPESSMGGSCSITSWNGRQQVVDRYLQSSFGLWNALLTVNGILLAAFSFLYASVPQTRSLIVMGLIGSCVLSLFLLVYNFVATKLTYLRIGGIAVIR